jgi:hypothetical protein
MLYLVDKLFDPQVQEIGLYEIATIVFLSDSIHKRSFYGKAS